MNFYKTLIILSCLSSIFSSYLVYQIKNEPKVVKTEIIKQEIPAINVEPILNIPKMELLTGDDTFSYIREKSGFDLKQWLLTVAETKEFSVTR